MSVRTQALAPGSFYHVYNRGTDKRKIFLDQSDHDRFIELLYLCNTNFQINVRDIRKSLSSVYEFDRGETLVSIGAYCLMPNHFHLLLTSNVDGGFTRFVRKLCTAYSMYFNKKYERTGALFQGRFKSELADEDVYLKYLYSYIHLNPVKLIDPGWRDKPTKSVGDLYRYAKQYRYSSLQYYLGIGTQEGIISSAVFPDYFSAPIDHERDLFEWLSLNPTDTSPIYP